MADGFSRLTEDIPTTEWLTPEKAEVNNQSENGHVSDMYREDVGNPRTSPASERTVKSRRSRRRRQDIMVGDLEKGPNISITSTMSMIPNISSQPSEDFVDVAETSSLNTVMAINTVDGTPVRKKRKCKKHSRNPEKPNEQENPNPILNLADSEHPITDRSHLDIMENGSPIDDLQPDSDNQDGNLNTSQQSETDEQRYKWFTSVHNAWLGHRGLSATLDLLKKQGCVWTNIRTDVANMIMKCPTCQKLSVRKLEY